MKTTLILLSVAVALAYCAPPLHYGGHYQGGPRSDYRQATGLNHLGGQHYGAPRPQHYGGAPPRSYGPVPQSHGPVPQSYGPGRVEEGGYNKGNVHGRQMEYTLNGPNQSGKMKVTETHVQMDRRMNGQEAEQAMKQIMGSMGDSKTDFRDFVKDIGFPEFARH